MIKFGRYNLCFFDLVTDRKDGKLDGAKIWQHISNGIICWAVLSAKDITWELITALGAVVGGSYVGTQWLKKKYDSTGGDK
jgi:hypothetical protein